MHAVTVAVLASLLLQIAPQRPQKRNEAEELARGQAILHPRFDKDEDAFKKLNNPSTETVDAERDLKRCFDVARSTEGMYDIPAGQGIKPNCDRQFVALEKLLK